jgi:uncharacterized protein YpmS
MDTNMLIVLGIVALIIIFSIITFVVVVVFKEEETDLKEESENQGIFTRFFNFITSNTSNTSS